MTGVNISGIESWLGKFKAEPGPLTQFEDPRPVVWASRWVEVLEGGFGCEELDGAGLGADFSTIIVLKSAKIVR